MLKSLSHKLGFTNLSGRTTGLTTESKGIMSVGVLLVLPQSPLNLLGLSFNFIISPCSI